MKTCNRCNLPRESFEFRKDKTRKDGLSYRCKICDPYYSGPYNKNYSLTHKGSRQVYNKNYRLNNPDYANIYNRKRKALDPLYKLSSNLRTRLWIALKAKKWSKNSSLENYIGCSPKELVSHIENQFVEGMTWKNYGKWHVDHIIPLISAATEDELYKLCRYSNLQPLWAKDNLSKGKK